MAQSVFSYPITYRSLNINDAWSAAGVQDATLKDNCIRAEFFDYSRLQMRDQREGLHLLTGGDLGVATDVFRYLSLRGAILAPNARPDLLEDKMAALMRAFDVDEAQYDSPSTSGVSALDFYTPTAVPPAGFSSPVRELFYCRPASYPAIFERRASGMSALFALELVCEDPRRYLYTATTVTLNSGNGYSASCPNWAATTGRKTFPTVTITTSGNGHASFTLSNATSSLVLNLSASGATTVVVDCFTGTILKAGVRTDSLRTSSVASIPFGVPAGGSTWSSTNNTNITSVAISYRQARA